MAKFCESCGKKIEEGKACDCKESTVKKTSKETFDFNTVSKTIIEIAKNIFTKPITTIKKYNGNKNLNLNYILLGLASLSFGFFITMILKQIVDAASSFDFSSISSSAMLLGGLMSGFGDVNLTEVFLKVSIGYAVYLGVIVGSIYLITKLVLKKEVNYKKIVTLVGVSSVVSTMSYLLSTILLFTLSDLVTIVLALGTLMFTTILYQGIKNIFDVEDDKMPYTYVFIMATISVAIYLIMNVIM